MMEESQEILLNSLKSFGIEIASGISSVDEINPSTLFSICTQSLRRLPLLTGEETPCFPTSLPDSMADRVRICTDVACALKNLGFVSDISFHKFLYPTKEDLFKLVRFLVKRLSETSEATEISESQDIRAGASDWEDNGESTSDVCWETTAHQEVLEFSGNNDVVSMGMSKEADVVSEKIDQKAICSSLEMLCISKDSCGNNDSKQLSETFRGLKKNDFQGQGTQGDAEDGPKSPKGLTLFQELPSEQHNEQVGRKLNIQQLEDQWDNCRRRLQEDNVILVNSLLVSNPVALGKLQKIKDIELETESVLCEIKNREEECTKLTAELEKQPKVASRRSYLERITEITKNSRKQDADIERILKETRELQIESNSIEERLHRSYSVVDEMVFRESKKDTVSRQTYSLLTSIHNSFEEIREKILETDRTKREVADIDPKLATIASGSLDMEKLQADINAIKSENEYLQVQLHGPL